MKTSACFCHCLWRPCLPACRMGSRRRRSSNLLFSWTALFLAERHRDNEMQVQQVGGVDGFLNGRIQTGTLSIAHKTVGSFTQLKFIGEYLRPRCPRMTVVAKFWSNDGFAQNPRLAPVSGDAAEALQASREAWSWPFRGGSAASARQGRSRPHMLLHAHLPGTSLLASPLQQVRHLPLVPV